MPDYSDYLKLDDLLALQQPGEEHDEMLFIVIHQSYELWFKQLLHEIDFLCELLSADDLARANHTINRVLTILKMLVAKVDILETMTPLEFLGFRERLESGSGFQSRQFREFEFLLGHKRAAPLSQFSEGSNDRQQLQRRFDQTSLWDAFLALLATRGFSVPADVLNRDVTRPIQPSPELQNALIELYQTDSFLAEFCERMVDLDEGVQEWRYRHVKMVQRTIGTRGGTGGSTGAEYLATTLMKPIYPDLWAIRTEF